MTKIFYSFSGEGLGHATRTDAVIEQLTNFEVHLFTWGEAYEYFARKNYPYLHRIAALPFGRNQNGKISIWKTVKNVYKFLQEKTCYDDYVKNQVNLHNPSFFICDYEPILPRIAKKLHIPYISLDNQHRFSRCDLSKLPFMYRLNGKLIGYFSEFLIPRPNLSIISSFCNLSVCYPKTVCVSSILRPIVTEQNVGNGDFVLLYYKKSCGDLLLHRLRETGCKCVVYGCPKDHRIEGCFQGQLHYKDLDTTNFVRDLSQCKAVFSAAGNQLISEAMYFNKPLFMIPEEGQYEQMINAFYVKQLGRGHYHSLKEATSFNVVNFLHEFKRECCEKLQQVNGAVEAANIIKQFKDDCER